MPDETVDLSTRVDALEARVTRVEAMTEVVTAIRPMRRRSPRVSTQRSMSPSSRIRSRITACCWPAWSTTSSGPSWAPAAPRPTGRGRSASRQ
jgi:hypothetical protein